MSLKLYNTMGRKLEEFKPLHEGFCGFYGCGPTVYNYAHIGNLRAYVFLDVLDRVLCFLGYKKKHVMNITDIGHLSGDADDGEDKMVKQAIERKQSVLEIADFYTKAFFNDIERLNIKKPDVLEPAPGCIDEYIKIVVVAVSGFTIFKSLGSGVDCLFDADVCSFFSAIVKSQYLFSSSAIKCGRCFIHPQDTGIKYSNLLIVFFLLSPKDNRNCPLLILRTKVYMLKCLPVSEWL